MSIAILPWILSGLLLVVAYLFGSIPTGYLAGRYLKGIDIREYGSGSTGATNVLRTLGKRAAIAVLAIDLFKGVAAVAQIYAFYAFFADPIVPLSWKPWLVTATAVAAILGHSKSIWIKFTGGKSVATSLGVLLVMNPAVALGTLGIFAVFFAISRIVSLSSIFAAIGVSILAILLKQPLPYILLTGIAGVYVIYLHRTNIKRLLAGTEPKIGQTLQ